jgi:hypothetical protein
MLQPGNQPGRVFKNPATIDQLHSLIFNETFFIDAVRFDSDEQTLFVPFVRCLQGDEHKIVKRSMFREVYELPVLKCELRIHGVEEFKLINRANAEQHIFSGFGFQEKTGRIDIKSFMPLEFYMYVSGFHVEYVELKQEGRAIFSHGRFPFKWESGPKFEGI